jgi:hypothetical protein
MTYKHLKTCIHIHEPTLENTHTNSFHIFRQQRNAQYLFHFPKDVIYFQVTIFCSKILIPFTNNAIFKYLPQQDKG